MIDDDGAADKYAVVLSVPVAIHRIRLPQQSIVNMLRTPLITLLLLIPTRPFQPVLNSPQKVKQSIHRSHLNQNDDDDSASFPQICHDIHAESIDQYENGINAVTRRDAFKTTAVSLSMLSALVPKDASAVDIRPDEEIKLSSSSDKKLTVTMPLVAYSFYKTSPEQAPRGLALALRAGIRHFDMGTDYGNFDEIAPILKQYWNTGKIEWKFEDEKEEVLRILDGAKREAEGPMKRKLGGKNQRRRDMFLTYKLANSEQSTNPSIIRDKVNNLLSRLDTSYLDLVSLHSPLPGSELRIATYKTLLQLKEEGLIHSVGVCNYGLCHLKEISANNLPLPSVNQVEISPFNTHKPIVQFCTENNIQISCAAWSKLSSVSGPVEQWAQLGELAKLKGVTKAQILVRWALQKGYGCAPRSGTGSKLEVGCMDLVLFAIFCFLI